MNIDDVRNKILNGTYPSRVIQGRQNKHIPGTKQFSQNQEKMRKIGSEPSILEADAQMLADKFKGTGTIYFSKNSPDYPREDIDTGEIIGKTWDRKKAEYINTAIITISYSKTGIHIYPNNIRR